MSSGIYKEDFYQWLMKQQTRNDPIGDLSKDASTDKLFPRTNDFEPIAIHLQTMRACENAMNAFYSAIEEWGLENWLWKVEYSNLADESGSFPYHTEPIGRCHPDNDWSESWETVFIGTSKQCFRYIESNYSCEDIPDKTIGINKVKRSKTVSKERGKMTPKTRYTILKRDNFKCVICGREQVDGVKMHVDHIIPISKGGLTEDSNLQTLCSDCNLGKGAQFM